jgi:Xaa-Pro aminopeptidase
VSGPGEGGADDADRAPEADADAAGQSDDPSTPAVPTSVRDDRPATDREFLRTAVADADATGFVHVGDRFDDDLRYLTRFEGPDRRYAFVFVDGEAHLLAPALFAEQARREFDGTVVTRDVDAAAGERAAQLLADHADGGTVLVPQQLPHDAAVYLERAGFAVRSTPAVTEARAVKTDTEVDHLRRVQRAAVRGVARAAEILAEADPVGDELHWQGAPLSTERLRRQVNVTLAAEGVRDAGNTVVGAGETCADLHFTGLRTLRPSETVLLDVSPRGPAGYYGDCTRTFVVDGDGGWERRAGVAVEAARTAALDELAAGVPASQVHREAAAEIAAYGFAVDREDRGFVHSLGHGVGLSLHEAPSFRRDAPLEAGHVVTIEPGVYDPSEGGVRIEDLALVTEDGAELLATFPTSLTPGAE